ncbi:MAG: PHP domain-containing protein, partial [Candidatus Cloacimonetes bacterium]|nr:PHP domain-containing protein [Candidatus Cloacimonadota bacterium]
MYKTDYHIHAEYSIDSSIKARELIQLARELGYKTLAFTEHLDLLPWEA